MDRSKWEYKKLGEVCAPKSDILRANKLFGNDDIIDYVDISSIDNTTHCITQPTSYVFKEAPSRAQQKVEQGDVLYSLVRPNLKNIAVVTSSNTDKYVASSGFCVLRGKDVETRYLYHMVLGDTFTNYILGLVSGANYPAVREDDVKGFSFRCPPLADQQRIVAELDCLNEMIALKQEQLKEFDKLARSIFHDMFGDKDFPKYQLKDVLSKIGSGATPSGGNQSYKTEGISLIRSLNVHNNEFVYKDLAFIDEQQAKQLNNVTIEENDVLLNITGASVARCCIVPSDVLPARVNQHVSILRPRNELLDCLYLCHYLISCEEQTKLLSLSKSKAATREALPKNLLEKYMIKLPPLALQQQFAEKIQAIEAQKVLVKKIIAETQQLLDSRMDYYFD